MRTIKYLGKEYMVIQDLSSDNFINLIALNDDFHVCHILQVVSWHDTNEVQFRTMILTTDTVGEILEKSA